MDRREALGTIRALMDAKCIVQPSLLSIEQEDEGKFAIIVKEKCEIELLRVLSFNRQNGNCKIYKP